MKDFWEKIIERLYSSVSGNLMRKHCLLVCIFEMSQAENVIIQLRKEGYVSVVLY